MTSFDNVAIDEVRREIEASKGTRVWEDYVNSLRLVAQVVFTRSSGFILEFLQNAEDAGLGLQEPGRFTVSLRRDRVKITHNGRPFTEPNLRSICGVTSSKKPEQGTLGYLGIGFKSVFKVTDRPEIYSGRYAFKFDRGFWDDPAANPWHVLPLPLNTPSEEIDTTQTTFVIPFNRDDAYDELLPEVDTLSTQLYMFLRWIKHIEFVDEEGGRRWVLGSEGEDDAGITTVRRDSESQRFKIFRRERSVPDWVKKDRLTQEYRADVLKREVSVAFALDNEGRIATNLLGAMYGGVYSFQPVGEARSGAKFLIQADFLVQPGRDAINYEAAWNRWLIEQVGELCVGTVIPSLKNHPAWRYQILDAFDFMDSPRQEPHDLFFGRLHEPIAAFLQSDLCVPTIDGAWATPATAVRTDETDDALQDFQRMGLLAQSEIAPAISGDPDAELAHPEVSASQLRVVNRLGLMENEELLRTKAASASPDWFRRLYVWLAKHPRQTRARRGNYYPEGYHPYGVVLTGDGKLEPGGGVSLIDLPSSDQYLADIGKALQASRRILHPGILEGTGEEERTTIRGFLTGRTGVQVLDLRTVVKDELLPRILASSPMPNGPDLLRITNYCKGALGAELERGTQIWVSAKDGSILRASEVVFSADYAPVRNWEANKQYVPGLNFLSPVYLGNAPSADEIVEWREFFRAAGVRENPDNGVEIFAENYAKAKLGLTFPGLYNVDKLSLGYDLEATSSSGSKSCVEVKGLSAEQDVELTPNETRSADSHRQNYHLCVVSGVPDNAVAYLVTDPVVVGEKDRIVIPVDKWKPRRVSQ